MLMMGLKWFALQATVELYQAVELVVELLSRTGAGSTVRSKHEATQESTETGASERMETEIRFFRWKTLTREHQR